MSAGILKNDTIRATEPTWHKLETLIPSINTFEETGLNWEVEKRQIYFPVGNGFDKVPEFQTVVRSDLNLPLGVVKDGYTPIQNSRVWEAIQNSLKGINYKVLVTGSLKDCQLIFVSLSLLDKQDYLVGKDKFKNYLTFFTSHNGRYAFEAYDTSLRVCCLNTLNWSRRSKGAVNFSVVHTKNNEFKIKNMEEAIETLFIKREEFYQTLEYLMTQPIAADQAKKILTGFVGEGKDELSTRTQNQVDAMMGLFQRGRGNLGQTRFDLFNGVTDYYTHEATDNRVKALNSNEFGASGTRKLDFYELLLDDTELAKAEALGGRLIASTAVSKPVMVGLN